MLYVCVPVHNEAATVGVLLWRLRTVLQEAAGGAGRDYEVVVYDDASTDATAEVLAPYTQVMPLTVLGGPPAGPGGRPVGASGAVGALLRHVAEHARYPRRDACVVLQGDFSEAPDDLPAFLAAFDGGADLVVARRPPGEAMPAPERRLRRLAPWVLRPLVRVEGIDDLLAGPRLLRVSVLRDVLRDRAGAALLAWAGWAGRAELVVAATPHARRVGVVDLAPRAELRTRASRLDWAQELRALARFAWQARGTRVRPTAWTGVIAPPEAPQPRPEAPRRRPADVEAPAAERPRRSKRGAGGRADAETSAATGMATQTASSPSAATAAEPRPERPRAMTRTRRERLSITDAVSTPADAALATRTTPAATPAADDAGVERTAADLTPAQRKRKRRSRRRSAAAAGEPVPGGPDEPTGDDGVAVPDDAPVDASPDNGDAAAGEPARKRRRRRTRTRSAENPSGVSDVDAGGATESAPGQALHPRTDDGRPSHASPSVPSGDRPAPAE